DPALADVEKALVLAPNSVHGLLERGTIRRLKGDLEGARQDWDRIGRLAPGSKADLVARANLEHLELGQGAPQAKSRRPSQRQRPRQSRLAANPGTSMFA